jgi:hypothetical protein
MMQSSDQLFAYAFFGDEAAAAAAVQTLLDHGFDTEHIGVLMRDQSEARGQSETREVQLEHKTGIRPGAVVGSVLGAAAGVAALPAAGVIAIGGAFGGAAVGGAAGTLMGTLGGLGIWKEKPAVPHEAFEEGGVLVGALTPPERAEVARESLREAGARDPKLATQAEAKRDLETTAAAPVRSSDLVNPDRLARNIFLLSIAYVLAVAGSIWLFIRPV